MKEDFTTDWESMDMEKQLVAEGRSDDFIAGARWSWENTMKAMRAFAGIAASFKQVPAIGILRLGGRVALALKSTSSSHLMVLF